MECDPNLCLQLECYVRDFIDGAFRSADAHLFAIYLAIYWPCTSCYAAVEQELRGILKDR